MGNTITPGSGEGYEQSFSPMSVYIGEYMQELYNWTNYTAFYTNTNAYLFPFYRKVQNWERWINGTVPTFHNFDQGLVPTHLAKFIVDRISAIIVGDGVNIELDGDNVDRTIPNDSLRKIGEFVRNVNLNDKIHSVVWFAAGLGTGAFKLNYNDSGELWVDTIPMSRMRYDYDMTGKPVSATFQVDIFFRNNTKDADAVGLFEKRKMIDGKAYVSYSFYRVQANANQSTPQEPAHLSWKEVPTWAWEQFKEVYGDVELDKPILLGFRDIGLYPYRFTPFCSSMTQLKYGDSVLEGLNKYLCDFDILQSAIDTEIYCSRARVFAKKGYVNPAKQNQNAGIDTFLLHYYDGGDNSAQPLQFSQPEIRSEQLKSLRNQILENIATAIQVNTSTFASFLGEGTMMTARQVSVENTQTDLFVSNKRKGLSGAINDMLDTVAAFMGLPDRVRASFSLSGQSNYSMTVDNTARKYQSGIMSLESAVRAVNPGLDEAAIAKEIEQIKKEAEDKRKAAAMNMWGNMDSSADIPQ